MTTSWPPASVQVVSTGVGRLASVCIFRLVIGASKGAVPSGAISTRAETAGSPLIRVPVSVKCVVVFTSVPPWQAARESPLPLRDKPAKTTAGIRRRLLRSGIDDSQTGCSESRCSVLITPIPVRRSHARQPSMNHPSLSGVGRDIGVERIAVLELLVNCCSGECTPHRDTCGGRRVRVKPRGAAIGRAACVAKDPSDRHASWLGLQAGATVDVSSSPPPRSRSRRC